MKKMITKKEVLKRCLTCLAILLALGIALCAAYVSGQRSGLAAPGAEVIECPAETAAVVGCPTEAPVE